MQKTWLITGVSSGLGRLLAQKALARGDNVVGTSRSADALRDLRERYSPRLCIVTLELRDQNSVRAAVDRAFEERGRIDIVVSNAGYGLVGAAEEVSDQQVRDIIATNLVGSITLIQAAQSRWRAVNAPHLVALVRAGATFERGILIERPEDTNPESGGDQQVA